MELIGTVPIYIALGIQVTVALFLGGLVGYDREKKLKTAGIKTNILICLGAALYTSVGQIVAAKYGAGGDPNRMAAQIVSGIGFLGAGAIIQSQGSVVGMTTAAMIWMVAAIGFTVGAGYPFTAAFFTISILIIFRLVKPVYGWLENEKDFDLFRLEILSQGSVIHLIQAKFEGEELEFKLLFEEPYGSKKGKFFLGAQVFAHKRHLQRVSTEIKKFLRVEDVGFYSVSEESPQTLEIPVENIAPLRKKKKKVKATK